MSDRLASLQARLVAANKGRDVASASLSDDDRAELELRKAIAEADTARRAEESAKRLLDLDRRFDAAREAHGPAAKLRALSIKEYEDTFVLMYEPKSHSKFQDDTTASVLGNKKLDRGDINRAYAAATVIDWNGITDWNATSLNGRELNEFLKKHPGIVAAIITAAAELGGSFVEEHKSGT
jgi:hypothetical protein